MTVLQFSLFFAALLIGYVLVHVRLARFEEHLQKLGGVESIDERLKQLVEAMDKSRIERLEAQLERLHEDLEDLRETTAAVGEAVVKIPAVPTAGEFVAGMPAGTAAAAETPAARIQALVETRLLQLGYRNVQMLTDLSEVALHGDADVQVECERGGMATKGRVQIRNFGVRDVAMQDVTPMFP